MAATLDPSIESVASRCSCDVSALRQAAQQTHLDLGSIRSDLGTLPADAFTGFGVVLTGSYARQEVTAESDCDYLVLVQQTPDAWAMTRLVESVETATAGIGGPGQTGTFGDFAIATELLARIGLEGDTNINMTRRLLLLFESVSVYGEEVRADVVTRLLDRYCSDYHPDAGRSADDPMSVPRFLLNDLVRYWRTMAVDFGAKQWRAFRRDWYLRYAKLLTSRKLLFAGSLMSLLLVGDAITAGTVGEQYRQMAGYLRGQFDLPPLGRLMAAESKLGEQAADALGEILSAYTDFIELMLTRTSKKQLEGSGGRSAVLKQRIEEDGARIQRGLEVVFFDDPHLCELTRRYGVF